MMLKAFFFPTFLFRLITIRVADTTREFYCWVLSCSAPNVNSHLVAGADYSIVKLRKRFATARDNVFEFLWERI